MARIKPAVMYCNGRADFYDIPFVNLTAVNGEETIVIVIRLRDDCHRRPQTSLVIPWKWEMLPFKGCKGERCSVASAGEGLTLEGMVSIVLCGSLS